MPPVAHLADAPHLQELREPSPSLCLVPRHILQRAAPVAIAARLRASAGLGGGAVLVHVALGAAFFALLSFRDPMVPREVEIPVDVVVEPPKATAKPVAPGVDTKADAGPGSARREASPGPAGRGGAEATKPGPVAPAPQKSPAQPTPPQPQLRPEVSTAKPAPPVAGAGRVPAGTAAAEPAPAPKAAAAAAESPPSASPPAGVPEAPKLVAPPPEAGKAATRAKEDRPANLVPDEHEIDQATREARPAALPQVLTTLDATAQASVPAAARARPLPSDRPTPATTAKVPSQADKLAAVLPMGPGDAASPFRSVLAGNATAQLNAAYSGVVQGRIRQATAELSATASARHLSGAVVVTFTVDDAGGLAELRVVQSSGDDQLDAMVLAAIQRQAPFPAPPPDVERRFNKAFLVGK